LLCYDGCVERVSVRMLCVELGSKFIRVLCGVPDPKHVHNPCFLINGVYDPKLGPCADIEEICTVWRSGNEEEAPCVRYGCKPRIENARKTRLLRFPKRWSVTAAMTRQIVNVSLRRIGDIDAERHTFDQAIWPLQIARKRLLNSSRLNGLAFPAATSASACFNEARSSARSRSLRTGTSSMVTTGTIMVSRRGSSLAFFIPSHYHINQIRPNKRYS
jgi:hypothetical protein